MPENLFTLDALVTLSGAAWATFLIVAYTSRIVDRILPKIIGTDLYAVFIAFLILVVCRWINTGELTPVTLLWGFFNAFLVAAVSGKMADKSREKKKGSEAQ